MVPSGMCFDYTAFRQWQRSIVANAPPSYGVYRWFESNRCYHVAVAEKLGDSLQNCSMLVRFQSATPFRAYSIIG